MLRRIACVHVTFESLFKKNTRKQYPDLSKRCLIWFITMICAGQIALGQAQKIKGSDTCLPLIQREIEEYLKKNPSAGISITGGGSGVGIAGLRDRSTDIAMLSRKVSIEERYVLRNSGIDVSEVVVAYDALAVIVHPSNPVTQLTRQQVEDIYCGRITNWSQLGGQDLKIIVYSREASSGTHEFFKEVMLKNKDFASGILNLPASGSIMQSVSKTPGAIAYIGLAYLNSAKIKALSLSLDGITYINPSNTNFSTNTYPVVRPLYLCYDEKRKEKVLPFIHFVLSEEGQKIVQQTGYIQAGK